MVRKPLIETNPYLRDPARRREMFAMTVYTSTGVEGVHLDESDLDDEMITQPAPADAHESLTSF